MAKDGKQESRQDPVITVQAPPTPPESEPSDEEGVELSRHTSDVDYALPPQSIEPTEILDADKKTPDNWLPRDPRLIRLTGQHPFNVEAPLTDLFDEGFLTSPELFYVRNHGAVPYVKDDEIPDWTLMVEGHVEKPFTLSFKELLEQYEQLTFPITLVCAGNRRKEQNVVRKTKGFSWGPAGVSTALWTGVLMADLLQRAKPKRGAKFVCMEGADELPNGNYGTSVKLNWAMDRNKGMMIAHGMNGEMLRPDHGKPLRAVIPGQIGGRSVKWLKRLVVTEAPSENWYHIYDNRVLPTSVSPDDAANHKSWWVDERYAIYDLNPNSAIAHPAHDETLDLSTHDLSSTYPVRGYAYSGGGRRVTRVEVSLDQGKSFRLAETEYPEDRYREAGIQSLCGGTLDMEDLEASFCWCFWKFDAVIAELGDAKDIIVRCMDESMNVQQRDIYWNVMGMMNNQWFRVTIHKQDDNTLRFEHPTQPALIPGGWMDRVKKAGGDLTNGFWGERIAGKEDEAIIVELEPEIKMTSDEVTTTIPVEDIKAHENAETPWFVLQGEVYDGTKFLKEHPGGAQSITAVAGTDCTEEFMAIHSETAKAMMKDYHIGSLDERGKKALSGASELPDESAGPTEIFLQPRKWKRAILHSKAKVSWDTRVFKFKLEHEGQKLGLPVGQHLMLRLKDPATRETIIRSYTPISEVSAEGFVDILIKVYFDTKKRKGGKMSQALDSLPEGHFIDIKGPIGKFEYHGDGLCTMNGAKRHVSNFIMVSGGSGITPMYQVLRAVVQDESDKTKCTVMNGNRLLEDILCKDDLDRFARDSSEKCRLHYTLTQAPDNWEGLRGRIAAPLLKEHCARAAHREGKAVVLICGPEALEESVHKALLDDGWCDEDLVFF